MSTRAQYVALRLPGTDTPTERFIVHAACSLAIHTVTVGGPGWLHVTYLLRRDRGESLRLRLLNAKAFRFPLLPAQRDPIHFLAEQPVKTPELLVHFSSSYVRHYPISF